MSHALAECAGGGALGGTLTIKTRVVGSWLFSTPLFLGVGTLPGTSAASRKVQAHC